MCFQVCKDDTRMTWRLHKPDLFHVLRKKKILKLTCHTQFLIDLLTLCETSETFFLTLQKNNKYLSYNVSLWSFYKFSWLLLTIVPAKIILKLHVLVRYLRKIAKSYFVMSVCLSARNNSAPAGRTFMKFDILVFFQNLFRKLKIRSTLARKTGTLKEDLCTFMISPWILLRISNVSDRNCRENQNTHFVFSNFFPP